MIFVNISNLCTDISSVNIDAHNYMEEYDFYDTAFVELGSDILGGD